MLSEYKMTEYVLSKNTVSGSKSTVDGKTGLRTAGTQLNNNAR